jgi:RNA polymerase-interacting CarD/CdnL/TRCF family regulator
MSIGESEFKKGDWVVHPVHGIGQVAKKVEMILSGIKQSLYTIDITDGQFWSSANDPKAGHIRPLAKSDQFNEALEQMREAPANLPKNSLAEKKKNYLENESVFITAHLIRDLSGKRIHTKLDREETLWLRKLKHKFLDEWALTSEVKTSQMESKMNDALKESKEKAKTN